MTELLLVGFVTGSDQEHDVGGVEAPSTSPSFGEHHAQIRILILGKVEQRARRCREDQIEDRLSVPPRERPELVWQREHHVEVVVREQLR